MKVIVLLCPRQTKFLYPCLGLEEGQKALFHYYSVHIAQQHVSLVLKMFKRLYCCLCFQRFNIQVYAFKIIFYLMFYKSYNQTQIECKKYIIDCPNSCTVTVSKISPYFYKKILSDLQINHFCKIYIVSTCNSNLSNSPQFCMLKHTLQGFIHNQ